MSGPAASPAVHLLSLSTTRLTVQSMRPSSAGFTGTLDDAKAALVRCYEDRARGFDPNELVDESGRVGDLAAPRSAAHTYDANRSMALALRGRMT